MYQYNRLAKIIYFAVSIVLPYSDVMADTAMHDMDMQNADTKDIVTLSTNMIQTMGIRTQSVQKRVIDDVIQTFGRAVENERLQFDLNTRVSGWIQTLNIKAEGDKITPNRILYTVYSPELISAQNDYLDALNAQDAIRIRGSEQRLSALGVATQVVNLLKTNRELLQNVPFYSERTGVVKTINVKEGSYIRPGDNLAQGQDYSTIWVYADIYEKDLSLLDQIQTVDVNFNVANLGIFSADIDYIFPVLNEDTRTNQVRLVVNNSEGILKPGQFVKVNFKREHIERLALPSEALLHKSDGIYVIMTMGQGQFMPMKVEIGLTQRGYTEILAGLNENDHIVISSQFLIDSESSLQQSFDKMGLMIMMGMDMNMNEMDMDDMEMNGMDM